MDVGDHRFHIRNAYLNRFSAFYLLLHFLRYVSVSKLQTRTRKETPLILTVK